MYWVLVLLSWVGWVFCFVRDACGVLGFGWFGFYWCLVLLWLWWCRLLAFVVFYCLDFVLEFCFCWLVGYDRVVILVHGFVVCFCCFAKVGYV